jgi:hypothetical protein
MFELRSVRPAHSGERLDVSEGTTSVPTHRVATTKLGSSQNRIYSRAGQTKVAISWTGIRGCPQVDQEAAWKAVNTVRALGGGDDAGRFIDFPA